MIPIFRLNFLLNAHHDELSKIVRITDFFDSLKMQKTLQGVAGKSPGFFHTLKVISKPRNENQESERRMLRNIF